MEEAAEMLRNFLAKIVGLNRHLAESKAVLGEAKKQQFEGFTESSRAELATATMNFDESVKIGEGSGSSVYNGILRDILVPTKVLNHEESKVREYELNQEAVPTSKGQALADEYGIKFFETSAKTNLNVEEAFFSIARDVKQRIYGSDSEPEIKQLEDSQEKKLNGINETEESLKKAKEEKETLSYENEQLNQHISTLKCDMELALLEKAQIQDERDNAIKEAEELRRQMKLAQASNFTWQELNKSTLGFSESLIIGEGGYGRVYKGNLRGTNVAIKLLNSDKTAPLTAFKQEVAILTTFRHPNLVTLIGACYEYSALVYKFLPNGSLEDHLNPTNNITPLTWQVRTRIMHEICLALIFLHSNKPNIVIHGDLKPDNVLLDANFVSKLGDFGISRLIKQSDKTACYMTKNIVGTPGYMDPDFIYNGELTEKSDVFSFGVIILRLLTGQSAMGVVFRVEDRMESETLDSMIDKSAGEWPLDQAKELAVLGLRCTEMKSKDRPNLFNEVLERVKELLAQNKQDEAVELLKSSLNEKNELEKLAESQSLLEIATKALKIKRDHAFQKNAELFESKEERSSHGRAEFTRFNLRELKEATKDFDNSLKIGEGASGRVYKGFLRHTYVAIKLLEGSKVQDQEFNQEVEVLSKVRHPNIVSLIGANPEVGALVHEYPSNGGLDSYLLNGKNNKILTWQHRLRIASEICSALIFLHSQGIAHGNLKPENVLLDSALTSKVSDFSLSRKLEHSNETMSPVYVTSRPKGSLAYIDPVYLAYGELTPQSDVFAFGIILLQFVTGRDPRGLRSDVEQAVDGKRLDKFVDSSAGKWPPKEALKLAELGIKCSDQRRRARPHLQDVYDIIKSIERDALAGGHSKWFKQ